MKATRPASKAATARPAPRPPLTDTTPATLTERRTRRRLAPMPGSASTWAKGSAGRERLPAGHTPGRVAVLLPKPGLPGVSLDPRPEVRQLRLLRLLKLDG